METFGKRWQLRLLAGLLAIFVTLYFTADLFGGIRADDGATIGASIDSDEDIADGEEEEDSAGEEEDSAGEEEEEEENELMLLAAAGPFDILDPDSPFVIDSVKVTLNRKSDQEPGTVVDPNDPPHSVSNGQNFDLSFEWHIKEEGNYTNYAGATFYYDQLAQHLLGISIGSVSDAPLNSQNPDAGTYSIDSNTLTIQIGDPTGVYKYEGTINISGTINVNGLPENEEGKFTIHFGDKYYDFVSPSLKPGVPQLSVQKTANGDVYKDADGSFYQDFTVTLYNWGGASATNVVLEDQSGTLFYHDLVGLTVDRAYTLNNSGENPTITFPDPIAVGERVTLTYRMKIPNVSNFVNGHDVDLINSNRAIVTADDDIKDESKAVANFTEPTITKNGELSSDGKTIDWTITVEPGIFGNTAWFPGETFTITDPMFPAGTTTVTFTNADFVDGKYVYSFQTDAPAANIATKQTVSNTATVTVKGESKDGYAEVEIPPSNPGTITKSHGDDSNVTIDEDGIATIPWTITATIPEADPTKPETALKSLTLTDSIDSGYLFSDPENGMSLTSFELTVDGKTYTVGDNVEWTTKYKLVRSDETIGTIDIGWGDQILGFTVNFDDAALNDLSGKEIKITYMFNMTEDSITNKVNLAITLKDDSTAGAEATDTYTRPNVNLPFRAEKNQDNYNAQALGIPGNFPVGWRVDVLSTEADAFKVGDVITITDTLPKEYELIKNSDSKDFRFLRSEWEYWPSKEVEDTPAYTFSKRGDQFTVRVPLNQELVDQLNKEGYGFSVLFATQMKDSLYLTEMAKGPHTLQIVNRAEVTFKGGKIPVSKDVGVEVNGNDILNKTSSASMDADLKGMHASYTIEVNKDAFNNYSTGGSTINGGADLRVTDELGTSFTLVPGSVKINKYVHDSTWDSWSWQDATTAGEVSYRVNGHKIEFTLKDNTYYQITYNVTGTVLDGDDLTDPRYPDEMKQEIDKRYGNTVSTTLSGGNALSHSVSLDSSTFRTQGSITYKFVISGTKRWPGGNTVDQIELELTQTEHVIDALVPKLGQDIQTTRTYHLVTKQADVKPSTDTDIYKKITIDPNGSWQFSIDDLIVSDQKGSSYSYKIREKTVKGYTPYYSFRPGGAAEWKYQGTDSDKYEIRYENNSSVELLIQNAKTSTVILPGNLYVKKSDINDNTHTPVPGATFSLKMTNPHKSGHDKDHTLANVQIPDATNVTHVSDTEITFMTTDVPAFINNLPSDHDYSIEETVPPSGFALGAKEVFKFGIRNDGSTYAISQNSDKYNFDLQGGADLDVRNERLKVSSVTIQKTDGATKLLSGAVIKITEKNNTPLPADTVDVIGAAAGSVQFNQNTLTFTTAGTAVSVTGLPEGTYTVSEVKAPSGYALTFDFEFAIGADAKVTGISPQEGNTLSGSTITLKDKLNEFKVRKVDSDTPNILLAGAKFTVARGSGNLSDLTAAPITVDGVKPADLKADSFTFTSKTSETTIKGLPAGTYTLTEDEPPEDYTTPSQALSFTVGSDGSIAGSGTDYTVSNKKITVSDKKIVTANITVKKVDADTNAALSGAQFTITAEETVNWSKVTFGSTKGSGNSISHSFPIGSSGAIAIKGLPVTSYTLTETAAPSGYALTAPFKFTVAADGTVSGDAGNGSNTLGANNTITLKDKQNKITLTKKDEDTGALLSGAEFEITAPADVDLTKATLKVSDANSVKIEQTKLTFITTSKTATIAGLPAGTYTLTETAAPTSYKLPANPSQTFTIKTDGTIDNVANNAFTVTNKMITADITVKKEGRDNPGTDLADAEFRLAAINQNIDWSNVTINGDPAGTGMSAFCEFKTGNAPLEIKGLPVGSYRLTETDPPGEYLSAKLFAFEVEVTDDGKISTTDPRFVSGTVTLIDELPAPGTLEISKIDAESGIMLPGAEFELTREDGHEIASTVPNNNVNATLSDDRMTLTFTTTDEPAQIEGLSAGKYVIKETKAPSGYIPTAPQNAELTVDASGKVSSDSISVENTATEISINKIDMTSAEQLPGAELTIKGSDGQDFSNVSVSGAEKGYQVGQSTLTFTTTDQTATVKGLPEGNYTLTETVAPDGYAVTTEFYFTIDKNGNVSETANADNGSNTLDKTAKTITLKDAPTEISINKFDMTSQKQLPGANLTISTTGSLTNAPISITEKGGTNIPFTASANELSFTTTDKTATIKGLPAGDYTLTETVAPDGYAVTTEFYFTIDKNGNVSETANADNGSNTLDETAKTITLNDEPTEISINKVDMSSQKQLPGAELFIRNTNGDSVENADVQNADSVTKRGSTLTFTTTDKTATIKGLPAGDYTLTEITAPDGYAKTTTTFRFTINPDGTVKAFTNTTTSAGIPSIMSNGKIITVENAPLAAITIVKEYLEEGSNKKITPTAALLSATSFGLFSDAQCNTQISMASPDTNGEVTFSDLADGTYYVKEISSPVGYKKDKTVYKFDVLLGRVTCYNAAGGTVTVKPTYTNISTTTTPASATDASKSESESSSEGSETANSSAETETTPDSGSSENTTASTNGGTYPTGSRPSGGTRPTGTTAPTTVTTAPTTATTSPRSTLTEPDEIEPEKTTAKTKKTKKTKKTTVAPETDLPKTTAVGTERTDIAIGVNQVTREPGIGIDSNLTTDEENPNTGVSLAPLTAAFAAAGTLAVVTRKKKKK